MATLRAVVRTRLTAGLITILPIVITIWLVRVVFGWLRDASLWVVEAFLLSRWGREILQSWGVKAEGLTSIGLEVLPVKLQWGIATFSVLLTFFLLYVIGMFAAGMIGRRLIEFVESIVDRLPFVKTIYRTLKQMLELFGGGASKGFQRVVLVPFPNQITRSVGFVTSTFRDVVTGEELCAVFVAKTPNPTSGFVFVLRRADIIEVNWSVEDAVKTIMSGGILTPGEVTMITGSVGAARLAESPLHSAAVRDAT